MRITVELRTESVEESNKAGSAAWTARHALGRQLVNASQYPGDLGQFR
jgi:hypothetical protein